MEDFTRYEPEFVVGPRSARFLICAGSHLYKLSDAKRKLWRCRHINTIEGLSCRGAVYLDEQGLIRRVLEHNHPPSILEVNVMKKRSAAMQTVINTPEIPTNTVVTNLAEKSLSLEERAVHGTNRAFARAVQRKKASLLQRPKKPKSLDDLVELPDSHSKTADGERFLVANFMSNNKRNLLFASRQGLNMIKRASAISGDGTFDLAPDLF